MLNEEPNYFTFKSKNEVEHEMQRLEELFKNGLIPSEQYKQRKDILSEYWEVLPYLASLTSPAKSKSPGRVRCNEEVEIVLEL
jgi:hypothetical protein